MRLLSVFRDFLADLRRQKLRSALTILGITWGTVAVVVLLAFGSGLGAQMEKNARGIGEQVVILSGGRTALPHAGFSDGRRIRLVEDDVALLQREVPGIARISPEYGRWTPVRRDAAVSNPYVTGVYPVYEELRNVFPQAGGRFINEQDLEGRRRVVVLGDELKGLLFGDEEAVGREIHIGGSPFLVVGVMAPKTQNSSYNSRDKDRAFIPASTYQSVFGDRYIGRIIYAPADPEMASAVSGRIYEVLGARYRFAAEDRDALSVWDTNEAMKMMKYIFIGFNVFLAIVGSFTLVVGGIGVANIMYIVVRERTREIGIKRALGARRSEILGQVLFETLLVVSVGALIGLAISAGLVKLVALAPIEEYVGIPVISAPVLAATSVLLLVIALLAGLFPARRAARLDPVECLRY